MHRSLRSARQDGFTLLEVAIVLALVGLMLAMAIPSLGSYQRRQQARRHVQRIASALGEARSLAIKEGNPYFVLFTDTGTVQIVDDDNGDFQIGAGEATTDVDYAAGADPRVTYYGALSDPPASKQVPEDNGAGTPIPTSGSTFPPDPVTGWPAVAFTTQGFPVGMPAGVGQPPGQPGTGQGSYYVTDNTDVIYAATLLPLGGTRVRVYRPTVGDWY